MSKAQIYANVKQIIDDLNLPGEEPGLLERSREASAYICALMGDFVPVTGSRTYEVTGTETTVDPLISITSITDGDGVTIASGDYKLCPLNKTWENGPYRRISGPSGEKIILNGQFGLWDQWESTGLSGTLAAAGTTSLVMTNGAVLWPGMVIKIEDEQLLVTAGCGGENSPDPTAAVSQTGAAMTESDEVITVDNGAEFFAGEVLRIEVEDVLIRRKAGNTLVVSRGWNNTHRDDHAIDKAIYVYRTVTVERGINGTTAAAHASKAISVFKPPEDVNYLARQMAALMRMKAMTGFSGRAGNPEAGESFWVNEFPSRVIDAVRWNYKL